MAAWRAVGLSACIAVAFASPPPLVMRPRLDGLLNLRGGGPMQLVSTVKTPKEAYDGFAEKGAVNAKTPLSKMLYQSIMGGCYVGYGGLLSMSVAGAVPGIAGSNVGLQRLLFAALFPMNLLLILMTGGQLFTGNSAAVPAAYFEGLVSLEELIQSWVVSYAGNVIGCSAMALAATYAGMNKYGTAELAVATAVKKCSSAFGPTVMKAILCNWLVCLAVFLAGAANDLAGKMVGIWFPISCFVAIGLEHSVANMFILPLGMLAKAKLGFSDIVFKNLIPVTIGNAIAGAVIVAAGYSFAFGKLGEETPKYTPNPLPPSPPPSFAPVASAAAPAAAPPTSSFAASASPPSPKPAV